MTRTTNSHQRTALERGRAESKAVRDYLEALRANPPRRGRQRTPDSIRAQIDRIEEKLPSVSVIDELLLRQQRRDLEAELRAMKDAVDVAELEAVFVQVAASYSEAKGISYETWREIGIEPSILKAAGIRRSGS